MEIRPSNHSPTHSPFSSFNGTNQLARNKETGTNQASEIEGISPTNQTSQIRTTNQQQTDPEIQQQLNELRIRDQEVRAHELAHMAAAGGLAKGGPTFEYQRGPDGRLYAVGGEVQIDTSGVPGDPEATLQKAEQIQRAALAPAQPSAQDRSVAVAAAAMAAAARAELANQRINGNDGETTTPSNEERTQRIANTVDQAYNNDSNAEQARTLINLTA